MKRWMIGDIRGELSLLKRMMDKLGPAESDMVIFLGSYLGPGPDSKGVVQYLVDLQKKMPEHVGCLRGCYEYIFQFAVAENCDLKTAQLWTDMGGMKAFKSYSNNDKPLVVMQTGHNGTKPKPMVVEIPMRIPVTHVQFMEQLPMWYEDDIFPYIATHCGGHPGLFGGKIENEEQTVFAEDGWWNKEWRKIPGKTVVFSHHSFSQPFRGPGKLGIDLGAGFGGKLCAFELFEEKFTIVG